MSKTAQAKTFRAWMLDNLSHDLETIAKHGYDGGVSGLAYYRETSEDTFKNFLLWYAVEKEAKAIVKEKEALLERAGR
ncbi:MAG: hypothetical protein KBD23_06195 [Gammaproteobacteria bacterium]|nr:hypothetical protein [Gammaproteobacteria bacterium]